MQIHDKYILYNNWLLFINFFVRTRRSIILIIKNTVFCLFAFFSIKPCTLWDLNKKRNESSIILVLFCIINSLNPRNVCTPSSTCTGCTTVPCGPCRTPCGTSCFRRVGDAATPASWGCAASAIVWGVCGATGGWLWGRRRKSDGRSRLFGADSRGPRAGDGPCRGARGLAGGWFRPSPSRCSRTLPRPRLCHLCLWNNQKNAIWKTLKTINESSITQLLRERHDKPYRTDKNVESLINRGYVMINGHNKRSIILSIN